MVILYYVHLDDCRLNLVEKSAIVLYRSSSLLLRRFQRSFLFLLLRPLHLHLLLFLCYLN